MFLERIIMGMPRPKKMTDRMKNMVMVLVRLGTGCHALSICCLNCSMKGIVVCSLYIDCLEFYYLVYSIISISISTNIRVGASISVSANIRICTFQRQSVHQTQKYKSMTKCYQRMICAQMKPIRLNISILIADNTYTLFIACVLIRYSRQSNTFIIPKTPCTEMYEYESDSDEFDRTMKMARKQQEFIIHKPIDKGDLITTPNGKSRGLTYLEDSHMHDEQSTSKKTNNQKKCMKNKPIPITKQHMKNGSTIKNRGRKTSQIDTANMRFDEQRDKIRHVYLRCKQIEKTTKREKRRKVVKQMFSYIEDYLNLPYFNTLGSNTSSDSCEDNQMQRIKREFHFQKTDSTQKPQKKTRSAPNTKTSKKTQSAQKPPKTKCQKPKEIITPKPQKPTKSNKKPAQATNQQSKQQHYSQLSQRKSLIIVPFIIKHNQQQFVSYCLQRIFNKIGDRRQQSQQKLGKQYIFYNRASKINLIKTECRYTVKSILVDMLRKYEMFNSRDDVMIYIMTRITNLNPQNLYILEKGLKKCKGCFLVLPTLNNFTGYNFNLIRDYQLIPFRIFQNHDFLVEYMYKCVRDKTVCAYLPPQSLTLIKEMKSFPISYSEGCRRLRYLIAQMHILAQEKGIILKPIQAQELLDLLHRSYISRFSSFYNDDEDITMTLSHLRCMLDEDAEFEFSQKILQSAKFSLSSDIEVKTNIVDKIRCFRDRLRGRFLLSDHLKSYCQFLKQNCEHKTKSVTKKQRKSPKNQVTTKTMKNVKKTQKVKKLGKKIKKPTKKVNKIADSKSYRATRKSTQQHSQESSISDDNSQDTHITCTCTDKLTPIEQQELTLLQNQLKTIIQIETKQIREISKHFKWPEFNYTERVKPNITYETHKHMLQLYRLQHIYRYITDSGTSWMLDLLYYFCGAEYERIAEKLREQQFKSKWSDIFSEDLQSHKNSEKYVILGYNHQHKKHSVDEQLKIQCGQIIYSLKQLIMYGLVHLSRSSSNPRISLQFYPMATYSILKTNLSVLRSESSVRHKFANKP